jgi:hypothetical protein
MSDMNAVIDQFFIRKRKVLVTRITRRGMATLYIIACHRLLDYMRLLEINAMHTDR